MSKSNDVLKAIKSFESPFTLNDIMSAVDASPALVNGVLKREIAQERLAASKKGKTTIYRNTAKGNEKKSKVIDISVENRFDFIQQFTKMVGKNVVPSLLLTGTPGTGKTFSVIDTIEKLGLKEDEDYIVVKGFSSPLGLYRTLYHHSEKLIIMDDADNCWSCPVSLNILKAALDSYSKRTISWRSLAAERNDLPESFDFNGSIIFISNRDASRLDAAVVSRTITANLILTNEEIVDRMEHLKKDIEPTIDSALKDEVLSFLRTNADTFENISLRTFIQAIRIRKGCSDNSWQKMILWSLRS